MKLRKEEHDVDVSIAKEIARIAAREKLDMQARARVYIAAIVCMAALLFGLGAYAIYCASDFLHRLYVECEEVIVETGESGVIVQGDNNSERELRR